eukprot:gene4419-6246_t
MNHSEYCHIAYRNVIQDLTLGYAIINSLDNSIICLEYMNSNYNNNNNNNNNNNINNNTSIIIDNIIAKKILKQFLQNAETFHQIKTILKLLLCLHGLTDFDSLQLLTNTFLKSADFVKGAVSMKTLPPIEPQCAEIAFIGRSNVGKSSLINMICNRKGLAFTSKTPGKTAEFNFFDVKGNYGINKHNHRFFLVDLPGVGYAEASRDLRSSWTNLLKNYVMNRESLRVLFHLIDSRHGLLDADEECLELLSTLPSTVQYIIVLTKVDKQKGSKTDQIVFKKDIISRIKNEIMNKTTRHIPILYTSSELKIGGPELWSAVLEGVNSYNNQP